MQRDQRHDGHVQKLGWTSTYLSQQVERDDWLCSDAGLNPEEGDPSECARDEQTPDPRVGPEELAARLERDGDEEGSDEQDEGEAAKVVDPRESLAGGLNLAVRGGRDWDVEEDKDEHDRQEQQRSLNDERPSPEQGERLVSRFGQRIGTKV